MNVFCLVSLSFILASIFPHIPATVHAALVPQPQQPTTVDRQRLNPSSSRVTAGKTRRAARFKAKLKRKSRRASVVKNNVNSNNNNNSESRAKPFSTQIGNVSFYGGLVTYTHALHPARICRILNGCVKGDGTLLLPEWLQRHDDIISFHCGHSRVEFSLNDTSFFPSSSSPSASPMSLLHDDLISLPPAPQPSMAQFVQDFMPSAVIFDLIYGTHERVSRTCHSRRGESCEGFPGLDMLKAAVVLPDRLKSIDLKKSWPKQFVNLMKPPGTGRQPKVMYQSALFRTGDDEDDEDDETGVRKNGLRRDVQCFRSVMFTRGPFNKNVILNDHLQNIHFLTLHGIDRRPRQIWTGGDVTDPTATTQDGTVDNSNDAAFAKYQIQNNEAFSNRQCSLNITIANRDPTSDRQRLVGRYIPNVNALRAAIMQQAGRIPRLQVHVQALTLEGKTLRWQMNAMQKTDILVGGHGPLLSNMIFLRDNTSSVIEIQPFSYYPNTYERMAQYVAHISHERYIAHPDYPAFHACISQLFPPAHPFRVQALSILRKFALAVDKYRQSDSTHTYVLHTLDHGDPNLQRVIVCAKMQRLDSHADKLAIAIVRTARLTCGLPLPTTAARGLVATA